MGKIWAFVRRDARHLHANVISLVVIVGIIVVPTFYAWFNIAGSWDPYGNTRNLKVAVANSDEGYTSELMPVSLNLGERVVTDLRESSSIGYVVTDKDDAVEGVRSGEYYAAIVIPEDFSRSMMTVLSDEPSQARVNFYQNEKANAIAEIVTSKASTAVQQDIDASFARSITTVGAGVLEELGSSLDDEQVSQVAAKLDDAVTGAQSDLGDTADDVRNFSALLESTRGLLDTGSSGFDTSLSSTLSVGSTLSETASGIRDLSGALDGTTSSISDTLSRSAASLDSVSKAIDDAFLTAGDQTERLEGALESTKDSVDWQIGELTKLSDALNGTDELYDAYQDRFSQDYLNGEAHVDLDQINETRVEVQGLNARVQSALTELRELSAQLGKTADDLASGATDAEGAHATLNDLVARTKTGFGSVSDDYESNVRESLTDLADQIESAADTAESLTEGIDSTLDSVGSSSAVASGSLGTASGLLAGVAGTLDETAGKLADLHSRLRAALDANDLDQVRSILSSGPDALAAFIANPVAIDRNPVYATKNNGSAMTPFYTTLAIWIGGVILCALVRANPSERALRETGCGHGQAYVGRLLLFVAVGLLQSTLICAGDLYYLGVQCESPLLLFLACWVASFTFVSVIYSLTASFGDVGKAVAVLLMVIQVAGSGGTFPREMLPAAFQAAYPWLPFVHAENAMRAAMFGTYANDLWTSLGTLLAFVVASLLLGLVLRVPIIRVNEWAERKLEGTKLM